MDKKEAKRKYKDDKRTLKEEYKAQKKSLKQRLYSAFDAIIVRKKGKNPINPPKRSELEEIGNSVTHIVGAALAAVGLVLALIASERPIEYVSASIYSFGLVVTFLMSALYHAFPHGSGVKRLFRRFDYSSIYLLIGSTFVPILLCYVGGIAGILFFLVQWAVIAMGITFISVFGPARLRPLHITLYVVLGWCGLVILPLMVKRGDLEFLYYILGGGVIYSLGIIPFALKGRVAHFIWHFFVLAGAIVQWIGIYKTVFLR